jgi:hypothetical protein
MRLADLGAVTVGAYGTRVELADPVPALRAGREVLGGDRDSGAPKPDSAVFRRAAGMRFAPAPLAAAVEAVS